MNNKGEMEGGAYDIARKSVYWMVAGIMLVIVVLVYAYFLSGLQARLIYVPEKLKAEVISMRFANIPECFAYQDPDTNRVYPGVIDISKFNNQTMNGCYRTSEEKGYEEYNFRLKLKNKGDEVLTNRYFYGDQFTLFREVLVREGKDISSDTLTIYVQGDLFTHGAIQKNE
ncbi:MAG: hypothetical protein WCV90_04490 [Candidatus Woesearchaeota archaeon]|jgi:hypothetical protein